MQNPVTLNSNMIVPCCTINSLWPNDAISRNISGSTLAQEMTPDGSMLLPEPMLKHPQWGPLAFSWRQLHKNCSGYHLQCVSKLHVWKHCYISKKPMSSLRMEINPKSYFNWSYSNEDTWKGKVFVTCPAQFNSSFPGPHGLHHACDNLTGWPSKEIS